MSELGEILAAHGLADEETVVEVDLGDGEVHYIPLFMLIEATLLGTGESLQCIDCVSGNLLTITCTKEESLDEDEEYAVKSTLFN